jgi:hypothetical protein
MKRLFATLLVALAVGAVSVGCNGADEVTGPGPGGPDHKVFQPQTPTPRPTPVETHRPELPCWKNNTEKC